MKKLLVAMLSVVACTSLFAFAACGNGTDADNDKTNGNGDNGNGGDGGNITPTNVAMTESEWTEYWNNVINAESYSVAAYVYEDGIVSDKEHSQQYDNGEQIIWYCSDGYSYSLQTEFTEYKIYDRATLTVTDIYDATGEWTVIGEDVYGSVSELESDANYGMNKFSALKELYDDFSYNGDTDTYIGYVSELLYEITIGADSVMIVMSIDDMRMEYQISGVNSTVITVPAEVWSLLS